MSKIVWDQESKRFYESGVEKGVLYVKDESGTYGKGVAWNGLTAVNENPSGAEPNAMWADDIKYLNLMSAEEFGATIEAYTYPEEFGECDGSLSPIKGLSIGMQKRKEFAFSYVTKVGNDTEGIDYGYKIHIVYGALASPSGRDYATTNDTPEAITFSWEISTTPISVNDIKVGEKTYKFKPTAHITINSKDFDNAKITAIENSLYGTDGSGTETEPTLLLPNEVYQILSGTSVAG